VIRFAPGREEGIVDLKRKLGLAATVFAAFALVATAGAARGPQTTHHRQIHFKTPAAAFKYLKAHGVDLRGVVVQRGLRNYAGPRCPGKAWHCTSARHVIQFATSSASVNTFSCSASSPATVTPTPPDSCVIVQVNTTGNNTAKCVEQTTADGAQQNCDITQTNTSGANSAAVIQLITETQGQSQTGRQDASVHQQNGTGANNSLVTQTIGQATSTGGPSVSQSQDARQNNTISQNAVSGAQVSTMSQAVAQKATAGRTGSDFAPFAAAVLTGSQDQFGDGVGHVDQNSTGVSKAFNFQNMLQVETAPKNATVTQNQTGPFRCCTTQGSSTNDVFTIQQSKTQFASSLAPGDGQLLDENGLLTTSGQGHIGQFANQNGTTQSNSCDVTNGSCAAETAIVDGVPQTCSQSGSEVFCCLVDCIGFTPARSTASAPSVTAELTRAAQLRVRK
jgi:hypothetical protein